MSKKPYGRDSMPPTRASGIILHPTSLPSPDGIGDLGPYAYRWIDFLASSACDIWQVLPLGPTGYGDSPYQCFSAFAGNPYLVSPVLLLDQGLLTRKDLLDRPKFPVEKVDYGDVIQWKLIILNRAYQHFKKSNDASLNVEYEQFSMQEEHWLSDFSLFMAIKNTLGGKPWNQWPRPLRTRQANALSEFQKANHEEIDRVAFFQFLFFRQWNNLREYAHAHQIRILGDVPIFVAYDSSDVWAHPELFYLDQKGNPTVVAGVPPDYFSPTGQLWGNPLYRWDYQKQTSYSWWINRVKSSLRMVDILRLDHFRGFAGYWEVPAGMPTAEKGKWMPGPGLDFFHSLSQELGDLPILAEDLGEITPDVIQLRDSLGFPGMKILQFAFSEGPDNAFLPHSFENNYVVYSGTHDNDTTRGWFSAIAEPVKEFCLNYLDCAERDIVQALIRSAWSSVANYALAPMQDFLDLDSSARMNFPGKAAGNWTWRMTPDAYSPELAKKILRFNRTYGRGNYKETIKTTGQQV